jgi:hypothetical protein
MCRSIKVLRIANETATRDEISAAALQFVRKVSGYRKPSRANEEAFNRALVEISGSVERLLDDLTVNAAPAKSNFQSAPPPHPQSATASYENRPAPKK